MNSTCFTSFKSEIDASIIPTKLNNPFEVNTPVICEIAVKELQEFITDNQQGWIHNFGLNNKKEGTPKGKMFGVLVVKNKENELGYLITFSGRIADEHHHLKFVPSLFDISTDNYFVNRGLKKIDELNIKIRKNKNPSEISKLKVERKKISNNIQNQLFESYNFSNTKNEVKNVCDIFKDTINKAPPSAAGECAAPKLFQYAFENDLQPLAVAEFWYGASSKSGEKEHGKYYPACEDKCRPILSYMLADYFNFTK